MPSKKTTEQFINDAQKIHGYEYDYSRVDYKHNKSKVILTHIKCGFEFPQYPADHLNGSGCPKCSGNTLKTTEQFINDAKKVHGDKYDYSKVDYKNTHSNVILKHIKCGFEFPQMPSTHLRGSGCPNCSIINNGKRCLKTDEQFITDAKNIHGYEYDYSQVEYNGAFSNVTLTHICGFEFEQTPHNHLAGQGCPKCCNKNYSKACINWLEDIMIKENITIQHAENIGEYRIPTTKYKADGYCAETNTIYEYNGCKWHGCPKCQDITKSSHPYSTSTNLELYIATRTREHLLRDLGYNLVIRWECDII